MPTGHQTFLAIGLLVLTFPAIARAQVVVDNDDGAPAYTETGAWSTSGSAGYNGGTYRFANVGDASTANWSAALTETGDLELFVWYIPGSNRATAARFDVVAADGTHTVYVNQTGGGYTWESLGTFPFNAGGYSIALDAAGSSGGSVVIADAVKFGGGDEPWDPPVTVEIAPGVDHATWTLPTPQVNHVLEFDLADPRYTIEMGFAQGQRNYTAKEPVTQIAARYDTPSHDVIAAVNCSFFESGLGIIGMLGGRSNLINSRTDIGWVQQTYALQGSGEGWAVSDLAAGTGTARFDDGAEMAIGVLNYPCGSNTLALYTNEWGPSTGSTAPGVEVIVEGANYPLRTNKWMAGAITAVRTGPPSVDNDIPNGGFVLSACSGVESELLSHASVGDLVSVRFDQQPLDLNNARTMCSGNAWMVKDGVPFHGGGPERHPRTVLAWSGTRHWLVTFDGRQPGYAVGASVAEMQDYLINALQVDNAINLDGGGSTTMVIHGAVANCPSDGASTPCTGSPRSVPNALMLVSRDPTTSLPITDDFTSAGRALAWDDKFTLNPVVGYVPPPPGSDGYVVQVMNDAGGYETSSVGAAGDTDYRIEASIYCAYRPGLAADGFERFGLFARDDGNANFDSTGLGGGNCYALTYDSDTGRIRAGVVADGVMTDFLEAAPLYAPSTAWRDFAIECRGSTVTFNVDHSTIASVADTTHSRGRFGLAYHEYFDSDVNMLGTLADRFAAFALFTGDYDEDGDVDLNDYGALAFCLQGPGATYPSDHFCIWADSDFDLDVDLADAAEFVGLFTGP